LESLPGAKQFKDPAIFIFQISKDPTFSGTNFHTGRDFSFIDSVKTEVTFRGDPFFDRLGHWFLKNSFSIPKESPLILHIGPSPIGAGLRTGPTSDTMLIVHHHNPIAPLMSRSGWADIHAPGISTMVTKDREEYPGDFWESACLLLEHGGPKNMIGHILLGLTGHGTGMASNTLFQINDHSITSHCFLPLFGVRTLRKPNLL
jgi:hypothetical protein